MQCNIMNIFWRGISVSNYAAQFLRKITWQLLNTIIFQEAPSSSIISNNSSIYKLAFSREVSLTYLTEEPVLFEAFAGGVVGAWVWGAGVDGRFAVVSRVSGTAEAGEVARSRVVTAHGAVRTGVGVAVGVLDQALKSRVAVGAVAPGGKYTIGCEAASSTYSLVPIRRHVPINSHASRHGTCNGPYRSHISMPQKV